MNVNLKRLPAAVLALGTLVACADTGPQGEATVAVQMQQTPRTLARVAGAMLASTAGGSGGAVAVDPDTVATLIVRVTGIEFLPEDPGANADDEGAWVALDLGASVVLDLTALPTEGDSPLIIASGTVPVGDYRDVRLFVDSAAITFTGPLTLGLAVSFEAGIAYDVTIPSAEQTGIKSGAGFTVEADDDASNVNLLFSTSATFQNVAPAGTGTLTLSPVIRGTAQAR